MKDNFPAFPLVVVMSTRGKSKLSTPRFSSTVNKYIFDERQSVTFEMHKISHISNSLLIEILHNWTSWHDIYLTDIGPRNGSPKRSILLDRWTLASLCSVCWLINHYFRKISNNLQITSVYVFAYSIVS